jgi:hypothetical protein
MLAICGVETAKSMQQSRQVRGNPFVVKQPYRPSSEFLIRERHALAYS